MFSGVEILIINKYTTMCHFCVILSIPKARGKHPSIKSAFSGTLIRARVVHINYLHSYLEPLMHVGGLWYRIAGNFHMV